MTEKERLIKELENYEPYAAHFPHLTVDGKLILDVLDFLREQPEVVRCKDCIHAAMTTDGAFCKYCDLERDEDGSLREVYFPTEYFCLYGEVKKE